jgi:hypothetical protein
LFGNGGGGRELSAAASLDSMRDLLQELSTRQAGQAGTKDIQGLS